MKSKSLILMIVSLGFGLVAAVGISQVMGRGSGNTQPQISMGPVLVSVKQLDINELLDETNVKIENWPLEIIPENAATSLEHIDNKVVRTRMSKGLPILLSDVINKNEVKDLAIPVGYKVVALPVAADDTIAGLLTPGDKVDVIGIFRVRRNNEFRTTSKTFLKAITVFSVGNQIRRDTDRESNGSSIVGVLLNEKQAEQIVLVQKEAQLKLVLRGPDADDEEPTQGDILGLAGIFGNPEETDPEADAAAVKRSAMIADGWTTRIWMGNSVETYKYNGSNELPLMAGQQTVGTPIPSPSRSSSESDDYEDKDQSSDRDRGLEEDQYPGE